VANFPPLSCRNSESVVPRPQAHNPKRPRCGMVLYTSSEHRASKFQTSCQWEPRTFRPGHTAAGESEPDPGIPESRPVPRRAPIWPGKSVFIYSRDFLSASRLDPGRDREKSAPIVMPSVASGISMSLEVQVQVRGLVRTTGTILSHSSSSLFQASALGGRRDI
jgi:hypothetical protein